MRSRSNWVKIFRININYVTRFLFISTHLVYFYFFFLLTKFIQFNTRASLLGTRRMCQKWNWIRIKRYNIPTTVKRKKKYKNSRRIKSKLYWLGMFIELRTTKSANCKIHFHDIKPDYWPYYINYLVLALCRYFNIFLMLTHIIYAIRKS